MPHQPVSDNDAASQAMGLLSFFSNWLLARHQWIVQGMRCLVAGEPLLPLRALPEYDILPGETLGLPENLRRQFIVESQRMEILWQQVVEATNPRSALPLYQQLDQFQHHAERFMLGAELASQTLWRDFSLRDPLTGAHTRLTLNAALRTKQRACVRDAASCIALFEHDGFVAVNDHWGRAAGDALLTATAHLIQKQLRPDDVLFRLGSDQWLVLLAHARLDQARAFAARICDRVRRHVVEMPDGPAFHTDLSCGVAEAKCFEIPDAWIARAEQMLRAMQRGPAEFSAAAGAG